jgi:hypothetical protein
LTGKTLLLTMNWKRKMKSKPRNHVAKALWTPKFRPQVAKDPKVYTRKEKHKVKYA